MRLHYEEKIIITIVTLFFIITALFGTYKFMNARSFQLFGDLTQRVETNEKVIALTFDDGPTNNVKQILPLLDKYNAKATFFLIGNELEQNLSLGEAIAHLGTNSETIHILIIEWFSKHLLLLKMK